MAALAALREVTSRMRSLIASIPDQRRTIRSRPGARRRLVRTAKTAVVRLPTVCNCLLAIRRSRTVWRRRPSRSPRRRRNGCAIDCFSVVSIGNGGLPFTLRVHDADFAELKTYSHCCTPSALDTSGLPCLGHTTLAYDSFRCMSTSGQS